MKNPQSLSSQTLSNLWPVTPLRLSGLPTALLALPVLWGFTWSTVSQAAISSEAEAAGAFSETEIVPEEGVGQFEFDIFEQEFPTYLTQVENTLILFQASTYTVRIIERPGEGIFMNVFNRVTGVQRPNGRPARVLSTGSSGVLTYASEDLANGQSATYIVRIFGDNSAELEAISTTGATLIQDSGTVSVSNVPPGVYPPQEQTTIIDFEGRDFSTRVFERSDGTFMNVFDRPAARTILEEQRASIEAPRSENDEWQSYVSYGSYRGVSATYYARISPQGQAELEIFNRSTGARLAREDGNVTEEQGNNLRRSNYIVAVPGGINALDRVRAVYPEAYLDRSGQGDFVNAGAFARREDANVRSQTLQAQGLDARVVFREVNYR
ncbi:MAG: hypothetical protein AAGF66_15145 [Cyanobacteria bacterium P01_H01_bin.119]